ncbi:phosphoribosyltransferase family protein [Bacillus sp. FJAT-49736]|uniref:phosphoribosyltransferase family protein n=1 Tax=Bacillus sp. FJAT-49736 TaxID=2833582 RepID=UPI001BCA2414|nr:phosphoribosyltransferase family protein [Bacillus sp. FJAT-49736]MBS4172658.1 phosphoribosyltransferase family protein [Bacillus sp. FJAT-49736]
MSSKALSISSDFMTEYIYKIQNKVKIKVKITENDYQIPPQYIFDMAARINKKRAFLFVSRVLGKHLPVHPSTPLLASALLASKYMKEVLHIQDDQLEMKLHAFMESIIKNTDALDWKTFHLKNKTIFIGFAETATALGHAVFENFQNAFYFHTTRERLDNKSSVIHFEEEHSHASSHYCYVDHNHLDNSYPIVFIDDELTTGKTVLNIIQSIHNRFPRKSYTVLTLLDWRNENYIQQFRQMERELGIAIEVVSLFSGRIDYHEADNILDEQLTLYQSNNPLGRIVYIDLASIPNQTSPYYHHLSSGSNYLWQTGRFGIDSAERNKCERFIRKVAQQLLPFRQGGKTLCIGDGELMYIPMKIAAQMGNEVFFQSTTRSPIFSCNDKDYLIQSKYTFPSPADRMIQNYLYQIEPNMYHEAFVFFEREYEEDAVAPLLNQLVQLIPSVFVVTLSTKRG